MGAFGGSIHGTAVCRSIAGRPGRDLPARTIPGAGFLLNGRPGYCERRLHLSCGERCCHTGADHLKAVQKKGPCPADVYKMTDKTTKRRR